MAGPLIGLKVIEMAGLGPAPFCAMLLGDMGADVIRIERPGGLANLNKNDVTARSRQILELDLRQPENVTELLRLVSNADVLIEGFRPGVMERLGLGPDVCLSINQRLVYGRMTGWGQTGPLAHTAGHDINYISLTGVLNAIGQADGPPVMPLNLVGDFGGGGMLLACGLMAALFETKQSGRGQVVDTAMTDGSALLSAMMWGFKAKGIWGNQRGSNLLDGGAHFYGVYECADGKYVGVGSIEPQFYDKLMALGAISDPALLEQQRNQAMWPELRRRLAKVFITKTRDEWSVIFDGSDACVSPILDWDEALEHPHNVSRQTFIDLDGVTQPGPAPRFSRTPSEATQFQKTALSEVLNRWTI